MLIAGSPVVQFRSWCGGSELDLLIRTSHRPRIVITRIQIVEFRWLKWATMMIRIPANSPLLCLGPISQGTVTHSTQCLGLAAASDHWAHGEWRAWISHWWSCWIDYFADLYLTVLSALYVSSFGYLSLNWSLVVYTVSGNEQRWTDEHEVMA